MRNEVSKELKPCPFCGGVADVLRSAGWARRGGYVVECSRCKVQTSDQRDLRHAVSNWNLRLPVKDKSDGGVKQ